jgi:OOP family OmpA-OmpF porin
MRTSALSLIALLLGGISGCFLWHRSLPAPTKERIVLHSIVDFNRSKIRADSLALVEEAATTLKEHKDLAVAVEGYSDAKGSEIYNQKLSLRRARAVRDYLVGLGVDDGRILVVGKGASHPIATNATPEGRAQNRRVELVVYHE